MRNKILFCHFFVISFFIPQYTFSQCWPKADKLVPDKSYNNNEGFGQSVDYENNIAVVGAPNSDTLNTSSGIVYVFQFDGTAWNKIATLTPSDHHEYHSFGQTVMIRGDYIFVADQYHKDGDKAKGAIYVFKKPGAAWHDMTETSLLAANDPNVFSFGASMDSFDDTMIVGAPYTIDAASKGVGSAYIFQLKNDVWTQVARLSSSYPKGSTFGSHVAIGKNLAVVVAQEEEYTTYTGIGSSYVFEKDDAASWTDASPIARLTKESTDESITYLGYGLAIDETRQTIFIGDNYFETNSYRRGIRTYVKPQTGWANMTENFLYSINDQSTVSYQGLQFEEPYLYFSGGETIQIFKPDNTNSWNTFSPSTYLQNSDYTKWQRFGTALSVSNGHVVAGAPAQVTFNRDSHVVPQIPQIYEFIVPPGGWPDDTYNEKYQFSYMPKTATNFRFGTIIDIDGDYAVVGSPRDNDGGRLSGVAYLYHLDNLVWKKIAKLSPSDGERYDFFGGSVAISKNYVAVSAPYRIYRDENGKAIDFELGAVYIFEKPSSGEWADMNESYKVIKSDGLYDGNDHDSDDDYFGVAVDMDYPYLVVSKFNVGSRPNSGSVYVYNLTDNKPILEATLNPSQRDQINGFGSSLKIVKNTIAIAAGGTRAWFLDLNRVFIYTKNNDKWNDGFENAVLYPSDFAIGISFGAGIDMNESATKIIVGAPGWFDSGSPFDTQDLFKGAAYIYEKPAAGWKNPIAEKVILTVPNQPSYGCMGVSVHIEDRYAVVGSPQNYIYTNGGNMEGPGRVYFYQMPETGWEYKMPDKIIQGDESGNTKSDYFGSYVEGVYGFLMIGAIADDNQNSVDAGSVYVYTEYPFIYPGQTPICENAKPIQLTAYPGGGQWTGNGFNNPTNGVFDPALAGKGISRIHYKVDDCDASNTLLIDVKELVKPFSISTRDSIFFCGAPDVTLSATAGDDFEYQWSYGKTGTTYSSISNAVQINLKAKEEGFYKSTISNACSSQEDSVWVGNLYPNAGNGFKTCMGKEIVKLQGNYSKGIWSGDGVSSNGNFSSFNAGWYGKHILQYSVSPQVGCIYQDTLVVDIKGITTLSLKHEGNDQFCYTGTTKLTANCPQTVIYTWYYGETSLSVSVVNETSNVLIADQLGFYKVSVSDGLCSKDSSYTLLPKFNPVITPVFDSLSFCKKAPIQISAESIPRASYSWSRYNAETPEVVAESSGSFSINIKDSGKYHLEIKSHGCEYMSHDMIAYQLPADSLFVPNVITPDNDENHNDNDALEIYSTGIDTYSLSVFNRYGKEVYGYTGSAKSTGWTGDNVSEGVYFVVLTYFEHCENRTRQYKGTLSILK